MSGKNDKIKELGDHNDLWKTILEIQSFPSYLLMVT